MRDRSSISPAERQQADLLAILDAGPMPHAFMSRAQRQALQAGVDALIDYLDAIDPDPDFEPDADDELSGDEHEPSLGAAEQPQWRSQARWAAGTCQDLEIECEDEGADVQSQPHDAEDGEPDLGSLEDMPDQQSWASQSHDDEASLGAPEVHHDQRRWGQGRGSRELDHDEWGLHYDMGRHDRTTRIRRETKDALRRKGLAPDRGRSNLIAFHPDMLRCVGTAS